MSDTEEDFRFFGTPLEPYDEDSFPSKKPISIEEQSARDAQGRRRFHGAFTGGFSAGFFNTVGSLEGWRPQEFKSSRSEKAHNVRQKPEDFMDDEDMGEFGIAPQVVQATSDYSSANSKKRKRPVALNEGPIPGEPVLESLLQAGNETVGYFLMKNISRKHKSRETNTSARVYGCHMPRDLPNDMNEIMVDDIQYELHEIYKSFLANPKTNTFGLGYVGLSRIFGNESRPAHLSGTERNNKKFSISGQAFGVGAFEDEDDDIYVKDDMSRYDFEMSTENAAPKLEDSRNASKTVLDIFVLSTKTSIDKNVFPPPTIPNSFTGKYKTKRSRFAPLTDEAKVPERKAMDATVRASFLGENVEKTHTPSNQQHKKSKEAPEITKEPKEPEIKKEVVPIFPGLMLDRFVSAQLDEDTHNILEAVKPSESEQGTKEMRDAVKLKMFGPLTHSVFDWQPCSFLCRKFDVPEPNVGGSMVKTKKRTKNLIFEYQKHAEVVVDLKPGLTVSKDPEPVVVPKEEPHDVSSTEVEVPLSVEQPQEIVEEVKKVEVIDLTERVDVAKNVDLFKSVFLSSDESEDEDVVEERKTEEIAESVVLEPFIPIIKTKEGILSNLDFSKFNSAPIIAEKAEMIVETAPDTYGPRLPAKLQSVNSKIVEQPVINEDEWVEKGNEKKHKKKHKKEKRKKHKHKSKR